MLARTAEEILKFDHRHRGLFGVVNGFGVKEFEDAQPLAPLRLGRIGRLGPIEDLPVELFGCAVARIVAGAFFGIAEDSMRLAEPEKSFLIAGFGRIGMKALGENPVTRWTVSAPALGLIA